MLEEGERLDLLGGSLPFPAARDGGDGGDGVVGVAWETEP